jgi:hypothetical protein
VAEVEVVFSSGRIKAEYHLVPDATSVVVFWHNLVPRRDGFLERTDRNDRFFRKLGMSAVCVYPKKNDWYLNDSLDELVKTVAVILKSYDEIINYGFSMGGYAAILTSAALAVDRVVAISPQFSVDSEKVPFEHRWRRYLPDVDFKFDRLPAGVQGMKNSVLVVDPTHRLDRMHTDQILQKFPDWQVIYLPLGEHPATMCLADTGRIGDFCGALLRGGFNAAELIATHRASRNASFTYWQTFARRAAARHPKWARRAIEKALELPPRTPDALFSLGNFAAENRIPGGVRIMRQANNLHPSPPKFWRRRIQELVNGKTEE